MLRQLFQVLLIVLACLGPGIAMAELVVVVNARNGVAAMTRNEVINIFFGRNRQFFNGVEAMPVDLEDVHPKREQFYKLLVGKDLAEINAYWSRQIFTGRMQAPPRLGSTEDVIRWIAANPGGIGFVELSRADARVRVVYELKR
jgi:ABC-type phosphate transport system substrate-binding protein